MFRSEGNKFQTLRKGLKGCGSRKWETERTGGHGGDLEVRSVGSTLVGQWRGLVSTNPLVPEGPGESRMELRWLLPWLWPVSGSAPLHLGVPTSQKGPQLPPGARFVGELEPETTG